MYKTLGKQYYKNREKYNEIYLERYNSDMAIHIGMSIHDSPAFFVITKDILYKITSIMSFDKKICKLTSVLPGEALNQYQRKCLIDEIVLTNKIEGVHSTRREIDTILDELSIKDKHNRFKGLVQKYSMLLFNEQIELKTCQDIRKIYDDLVLEEVKESDPTKVPDGIIFRKDSVSVESETGKELHRGVYPESKIIEDMEKALRFLNDDSIHMLLRLSAFHYLFGYIHPFYDGNGRTSRFISGYLMTQCLEGIVSYRLSYTIKERLQEYYKAFKECNDRHNKGDITPFIITFLDIILESIKQLEDDLQNKLEQLENWRKNCVLFPNTLNNNKMIDLYYVLIQATLFAENGISTKMLKEFLKISDATLRKRLSDIKIENALITKIIFHEKYYTVDLEQLQKYLDSL